jgi:hypothetical protein
MRAVADALEVDLEDIRPKKAEAPSPSGQHRAGEPGPYDVPPPPKQPEIPLPPLEELQERANLQTDWQLVPEERWQELLGAEQEPLEAYRRYRETLAEREAILPTIMGWERGLDVRLKGISGPYRRVYMRTLEAWSAAHRVAVRAGAIGEDDSLEVLEAQRFERALEEEKSQVLVAS